MNKSAHVGLFKLSGMMLDIEDKLNRKVDLVTYSGLMDFARKSVDKDKILIYERAKNQKSQHNRAKPVVQYTHVSVLTVGT